MNDYERENYQASVDALGRRAATDMRVLREVRAAAYGALRASGGYEGALRRIVAQLDAYLATGDTTRRFPL